MTDCDVYGSCGHASCAVVARPDQAANFLPCPGISRLFRGYRPHPPAEYAEKGITNSGSTPDYEGVVWSDGTVSIRWLTQYRSFSNWSSWDEFYAVHGHPEYGTTLCFKDDND